MELRVLSMEYGVRIAGDGSAIGRVADGRGRTTSCLMDANGHGVASPLPCVHHTANEGNKKAARVGGLYLFRSMPACQHVPSRLRRAYFFFVSAAAATDAPGSNPVHSVAMRTAS